MKTIGQILIWINRIWFALLLSISIICLIAIPCGFGTYMSSEEYILNSIQSSFDDRRDIIGGVPLFFIPLFIICILLERKSPKVRRVFIVSTFLLITIWYLKYYIIPYNG